MKCKISHRYRYRTPAPLPMVHCSTASIYLGIDLRGPDWAHRAMTNGGEGGVTARHADRPPELATTNKGKHPSRKLIILSLTEKDIRSPSEAESDRK